MFSILNKIFILEPLVVIKGLGCKDYLGPDVIKFLDGIYTAIQITVPILLIALITFDLLKAVVSQDDKEIKTSQSRAIKRVVVGIIIFFVPMLVDVMFNLVGIAKGNCGIGGVSTYECHLTDEGCKQKHGSGYFLDKHQCKCIDYRNTDN